MAQIIPKITIRSVNFRMLLLSAAVMIFSGMFDGRIRAGFA